MKIKTYKVFESVKSFDDYKLTYKIYNSNHYLSIDNAKLALRKIFNKNPNSKVWNLCESMESYLQEYIDDNRLGISTYVNLDNSEVPSNLVFSITATKLNTKESFEDIANIFNKLAICVDLIDSKKYIASVTRFDIPQVYLSITV